MPASLILALTYGEGCRVAPVTFFFDDICRPVALKDAALHHHAHAVVHVHCTLDKTTAQEGGGGRVYKQYKAGHMALI